MPEDLHCTRIQAGPAGAFAGYSVIPHWSESALGLFAPPEPRVYHQIAARVCALADDPGDGTLLLLGRPRADGRRDEQSHGCDQFR